MKETFETTAQELGGEAKVIIEKSYPGFKLENDDKVTQFAINSARELGLAGILLLRRRLRWQYY